MATIHLEGTTPSDCRIDDITDRVERDFKRVRCTSDDDDDYDRRAQSACKRRRSACGTVVCYSTDVERIQGMLDTLPMGMPVIPEDITGQEARAALKRLGIDTRGLFEKHEFVDRLRAAVPESCAICFAPPSEQKGVWTFLRCQHAFHRGCLHSWAQQQFEDSVQVGVRPSCPCCRKEMF